jgi:hypothetical protein
LLPKLEKKSLVPTSGKQFAPPTPQELRASWDAAQAERMADYIQEYEVLGPFTPETAPAPEALLTGDGGVSTNGACGGASWKKAEANNGFLNMQKNVQRGENGVAYATFEVESIHQRETALKLRSDDELTVLLNGNKVVAHESGESETPIFLQAGLNRFLVRVDQKMPVWGFWLQVPRANF